MKSSKKEFLGELIEQKEKQLLTLQWELGFMKEYHKDYLNDGALIAARTELGSARQKKVGEDKIEELEDKVAQVKDAQRVFRNLTQTEQDLKAQIGYFKALEIVE